MQFPPGAFFSWAIFSAGFKYDPPKKGLKMRYNPLEVRCAHLAKPVNGRFGEAKPLYCAFDKPCPLQHYDIGGRFACKAEIIPEKYKRPTEEGKA